MELKSYFAQDTQGNAIPNANCFLYLEGTITPAPGVVDKNGVPLSNPFPSDADALIQFAAPDGRYDLRVTNGDRDYTLKIQCVDLGTVLASATAQADRAANEADEAAESAESAASQAAAGAAAATARFLMPANTLPTTRDNGGPLQAGDRILNTADGHEYLYKSGAWAPNEFDPSFYSGDTGASQIGSASGATVQAWLNSLNNKDTLFQEYLDKIANPADPTQGGALVGYNGANVSAYLDGLKKVDDIAKGANLVGFKGRTVYDRLCEEISILDFFIVGQTNWDAAFAAARAYLIGFPGNPPRLYFPTGIYGYSVSPNWAITNADIEFRGTVRFRYTGTGAAVLLDGQANGGNVYNMRFGWDTAPIIEATSAMVYGYLLKSVHHSKIGMNFHGGGGVSSYGFYGMFSVCSEYQLVCSPNQAGNVWYGGNKPNWSMWLTELNPGELFSYCIFYSPKLEKTGVGGYFDHAFGNHVIGGTMEGCTSVGAFFTANAFNNLLEKTDFEVNTDHDIYCAGRENFFSFCDTDNKISLAGATAVNNFIFGGSHSNIIAGAGTANNVVSHAVYNRNNDGATIQDFSGGKLKRTNNINRGLGRVEDTPPTLTGLPVTTGAYTYTNSTLNRQTVFVAGGGTVSSIQFRRNGTPVATGMVAGMFDLDANDQLVINNTVVPVVVVVSH